MVKNTTGGNKAKKQKRSGYKKKEIIDSADPGQMFGLIIEHRGGNHVTVLCSDNIQRIGRLGGASRRGQKFVAGMYVLVSLWDFETEQKNCDVLAIANPPADIRNIFKKINPSKDDDVVEFQEDSKFAEFQESSNMVKVSSNSNTNTNNKSKVDNNINFADSEDDSEDDSKDKLNTNSEKKNKQNDQDDIYESDDGKGINDFNKLDISNNKEEDEINFDDI